MDEHGLPTVFIGCPLLKRGTLGAVRLQHEAFDP